MSSLSRNVDFVCKLILIGDSPVGKTSLIDRFTRDEFSKNTLPTLGKIWEKV